MHYTCGEKFTATSAISWATFRLVLGWHWAGIFGHTWQPWCHFGWNVELYFYSCSAV